jgi:hypothetical protein
MTVSMVKYFHSIVDLTTLFLKKVPILLFFAVIVLLSSQVMLLMSYFLPIKVVLLLATPETPTFLSSIFFNLSREKIIMILTGGVFLAYGIYLLSDKASLAMINKIVKKLLEEQENILTYNSHIHKFVETFVRVTATFFLVVSMYILIWYLYPLIGIIIFLYGSLICLIFLKWIMPFPLKYNNFFKASTGLGFMLVFLIEIFDTLYLKTQSFSILTILVVLIVARYIFTRTIYLMNKLVFMYTASDTFYKKINEKKL